MKKSQRSDETSKNEDNIILISNVKPEDMQLTVSVNKILAEHIKIVDAILPATFTKIKRYFLGKMDHGLYAKKLSDLEKSLLNINENIIDNNDYLILVKQYSEALINTIQAIQIFTKKLDDKANLAISYSWSDYGLDFKEFEVASLKHSEIGIELDFIVNAVKKNKEVFWDKKQSRCIRSPLDTNKGETNYDNGQIKVELCSRVNYQYYDNGQIFSESSHKNGKLHGDFIFYYPNGNLQSKSSYKNGKRDGELIVYHLNGKVSVSNSKDEEEIENSPLWKMKPLKMKPLKTKTVKKD